MFALTSLPRWSHPKMAPWTTSVKGAASSALSADRWCVPQPRRSLAGRVIPSAQDRRRGHEKGSHAREVRSEANTRRDWDPRAFVSDGSSPRAFRGSRRRHARAVTHGAARITDRKRGPPYESLVPFSCGGARDLRDVSLCFASRRSSTRFTNTGKAVSCVAPSAAYAPLSSWRSQPSIFISSTMLR